MKFILNWLLTSISISIAAFLIPGIEPEPLGVRRRDRHLDGFRFGEQQLLKRRRVIGFAGADLDRVRLGRRAADELHPFQRLGIGEDG